MPAAKRSEPPADLRRLRVLLAEQRQADRQGLLDLGRCCCSTIKQQRLAVIPVDAGGLQARRAQRTLDDLRGPHKQGGRLSRVALRDSDLRQR